MDRTDPIKLRMKIGEHEFEAEGPSDLVVTHLAEWKRLANLSPTGATESTDTDALRRLFAIDAEESQVKLRIAINGRQRNASAALLLLYGHQTYLHDEELPAARLRAALSASNYAAQRLDRLLAGNIRAGWIRKHGAHKNQAYSLTANGLDKAATLARHYVRWL